MSTTFRPEVTLALEEKQPHSKLKGLQRAVLTPLETLAQSIAGIAPSATPGMLIPIAFGFAGNGTWLSYLLATIGLLFTAQCINEFASRQACPGSLYSFVSIGLGRRAGTLTGWALLFAYVFCGSVCITEFAIYASSIAKYFLNINLSSQVMMLLAASLVAFVAWKNIKMSASLMLRLEFLSVGLILLIVALAFQKFDFPIDHRQINLTGVSAENVRMGLVMAIFGFVAFESAASLGVEAKDPLKTIPRALMLSVMLSGVFFVLTAYALVFAFSHSSVPLDKCSTPLLTTAELAGLPILGHLADIGIMISFFAAGIANLTASARTMYKMSHDGLFHDALGTIHEQNSTPHVATLAAIGLSFAIALILSLFNCPLLDIVGWLGTLATFGFIFGYIATSIAAAKYLRSRGELTMLKILIVSASILVMVFALVGSLYPGPAFPYNVLPIIFAVYMITCFVGCCRNKVRN